MSRTGDVFFAVVSFCVAFYLAYVVYGAIVDPVYQSNYTARYSAYQQGMTQRVQAEQQGATARWQATTAAAPWVVGGIGLTAALVVAAVQWGRSHRHRETERSRRVALLTMYAQHYLPDSRTQITQRDGEWVIVDHDSREVIPESVALLEMRQPQLPR